VGGNSVSVGIGVLVGGSGVPVEDDVFVGEDGLPVAGGCVLVGGSCVAVAEGGVPVDGNDRRSLSICEVVVRAVCGRSTTLWLVPNAGST